MHTLLTGTDSVLSVVRPLHYNCSYRPKCIKQTDVFISVVEVVATDTKIDEQTAKDVAEIL